MKKFYFILMALFCAAVSFTGCSDDDDDDKEKGNGDSAMTILPKKIVKIAYRYGRSGVPTDLYEYDAVGRLSRITGGGDEVTDFVYGDDQITIKSSRLQASVIRLKDGRADSFMEYESNTDRYDNTYSYSGKYVSKVAGKYFYRSDSDADWKEEETSELTYTVENGNLVRMTYVSSEDGKNTSTVELSEFDNNLNLDLYGFFMPDDAFLLRVAGERFRKLPKRMVTRWESGNEDVTTYSYELDADGYITKITEIWEGEEEVEYMITYE